MRPAYDHDALCLYPGTEPDGFPWICPCCLALRTARLQGPVKDNGHVQACFCPACFPAGYDTAGRPE